MYRTRFLDITNYVNESIVEALQKFAPNGLKLWNVFLPKPDVPPAIAANYRQVTFMSIFSKEVWPISHLKQGSLKKIVWASLIEPWFVLGQPFFVEKNDFTCYVGERQLCHFFYKTFMVPNYFLDNLQHFLILSFLHQVPNKRFHLLNPCLCNVYHVGRTDTT